MTTVTEPARFTVAGHEGDRLLTFAEVCGLTRMDEGALRWLRHKGESPLWKRHGRLVAWESEVIAWLEQERAADAEADRS